MPASPLYLYFSYNIIVSFYSLETQTASTLTDKLHGQDQASKREHSVHGLVDVMALRGESPACDAGHPWGDCSQRMPAPVTGFRSPQNFPNPSQIRRRRAEEAVPSQRGELSRGLACGMCVRLPAQPHRSWTLAVVPAPLHGALHSPHLQDPRSLRPAPVSPWIPSAESGRPQPALLRSLTTTSQVGNAQILALDPTILPTHCACPPLAIRTVSLSSHRTPIPVVRVSPGCPPPPPPVIPWVRHPSQAARVPVPATQLPVCLPASGSSHRPNTDRMLPSNNTPNPVTVLPVPLSQAQNHSPDTWPRTP